MELQTILNLIAPHQGFVYEKAWFTESRSVIAVQVRPHASAGPVCRLCGRRCVVHDRQPERRFEFMPVWGLAVVLLYAPRRVRCKRCGVHVERIPWATTLKSPITRHLAVMLSTWAAVLPWDTVARLLDVAWDQVAVSVDWVVQEGMKQRNLDDITAIGVDEMYTGRRGKFITLVYQLDAGCRRLLWLGRGKGSDTLEQFFAFFGAVRTKAIRYVCTDMSAAFIKAVRQCCQEGLIILDKFHIVKNLNEAVTETRRAEAAVLQKQGKKLLKSTRWILVKNRANLNEGERARLSELLQLNLSTAKGYLLAEDFHRFWEYKSPFHAGRFLTGWIRDVMRHRSLPHLKRFARTLRTHADLLLNFFRARKEFSSAAVEALNGRVRSAISASRGYRYDATMEAALFLRLGRLPMPSVGYRFSG